MTTTDEAPQLHGSRCEHCGNVAFPVADGCQRCGQQVMQAIELSQHGTVWGFTVQRFAPKSPPYVPPADGFAPFAVGYVELPDGVNVEGGLDCDDFADHEYHSPVRLTATEPGPRFEVVA